MVVVGRGWSWLVVVVVWWCDTENYRVQRYMLYGMSCIVSVVEVHIHEYVVCVPCEAS